MCIITEIYILTLLHILQLNRRILSHRIKRWFPFVLWDVSLARHHSLQFVVIFSSWVTLPLPFGMAWWEKGGRIRTYGRVKNEEWQLLVPKLDTFPALTPLVSCKLFRSLEKRTLRVFVCAQMCECMCRWMKVKGIKVLSKHKTNEAHCCSEPQICKRNNPARTVS